MRDESIDFFRGLIAIHIIMIHTLFHSGVLYVPYSISCWSLFFDIPIFMVLSGMTYHYHEGVLNKIKEFIKILYKWCLFVFLCFGFLLIVDKNSVYIKDIVSWLVFKPVTNSKYIIGVKYSLWFMIYFLQSSLFCSILISLIKKFLNDKEKQLIAIKYAIGILGFMLVSINVGISYFGLEPQFIAYALFFLVGYLSMNYKFTSFKKFIFSIFIIVLILCFLMHYNGIGIAALQDLKMLKMNYIYVIASFISIFCVIYLKSRYSFKNKIMKPIKFIGKNTIYLYFAQGISSSLLYYFVYKISLNNLYLKILVMFGINLVMSMLIFCLLLFFYKMVDIIVSKCKFLNEFSIFKKKTFEG